MTDNKIAFIGGGNMTRAIAGGLVASGFAASRILIAEPLEAARKALQKDFPGVQVDGDNDTIVAAAACVVLAVKPQVLPDVCRALSTAAQAQQPLIISIAAGPRSTDIDEWLGGGLSVVRVMPNQPALRGKGVSGVYANPRCTQEQREQADRIMAAVGEVVHVEQEADIDAVTAVSGSGPAYFFLLIDMLEKTAVDLGLPKHAAKTLAVATATGAAALAHAEADDMETLIARVRSPGGTTAAALDSLEAAGVRDIFSAAITAARDRGTQLGDDAHKG